jgi:MarR family transcriptional regulator, temperature-dependent positive regulator of motility
MARIKPKSGKAVSALERSPGHLLHRALKLALDIYAEEVGESEITQRQYAVLAAVSSHPDATQNDLVRLTGIDRSTLADLVQRMIDKGLLARERSATDARANAVRVAPAGAAALKAVEPKAAAADARLMKRLAGGGRRAAFVGLLRDLVQTDDPPAKPKKKGEPEKPDKAASKKKKQKKKGKKSR